MIDVLVSEMAVQEPILVLVPAKVILPLHLQQSLEILCRPYPLPAAEDDQLPLAQLHLMMYAKASFMNNTLPTSYNSPETLVLLILQF